MPTPHINAEKGDFAETILMPGDPLRAKLIAETYLKDWKQVCDVRGMLGFTGIYKGKRLSVMGHGMGIPSASIYVYELIKEFGVKNIIRIGSCGAVLDDIKLMDVVIAMGASTDSKVNRTRFMDHDFAAICDYHLLETAVKEARKQKISVRVGNIFTTDLFYGPDLCAEMAKLGILGIDMEVAGIYGVAAQLGAKALAICTVSDHVTRGEKLSAEDRQTSFKEMMNVALETAINL